MASNTTGTAETKIFISYRRDDSEVYAGWINERLRKHYGQESVFWDNETIPPGQDFHDFIQEGIASCTAAIVIIGPNWLGSKDKSGRLRLRNPKDLVRIEVATVLKRNIPVIPVVVGGIAWRDIRDEVEALPEELALLARRQAVEMQVNSWDYSTGRLIDALEYGRNQRQPPQEVSPKKPAVVSTGRKTILGVENLLTRKIDLLRGARVGLVCNQASVDHNFRHVADLFQAENKVKLTALFGPQHGIRGDVQDNMVESPHVKDQETGLPIYSLYSETREPTEEMLKDVDTLVCDMQDVGCRIYTFIYTLANCMRAAKRFGKRVVVCDRPNPIGGEQIAGTVLEEQFASFVGQFPLPTRHGMTVCELAQLFNEHWGIDCELELVKMEGWSREQYFDETDAPWVLPSPNMPTLDSAVVFPGTVHLEGTQMSEGRGTTRPFELVGAPYIEAADYARRLENMSFPGVTFRAAAFLPTFQKHAGRLCGGVQIHVTDRRAFEPVIVGVATVKLAYELYPELFDWKMAPYEYVYDKNPFDVIAGTNKLREAIERGDSIERIAESWTARLEEFKQVRERFLLY
jgi:uncharacterized protein YbbC (DUF1343 family)